MVMVNKVVAIYESPIGHVRIIEESGYIIEIRTLDTIEESEIGLLQTEPNDILKACIKEIEEYFDGTRQTFTFQYKNKGTAFREKVWHELEKIPYGKTISYGTLAMMIGNKNAARAVGSANHHNNLWLIVPCHRVIGADGSMTGYGGGIWRKEWLLAHEKKHSEGIK